MNIKKTSYLRSFFKDKINTEFDLLWWYLFGAIVSNAQYKHFVLLATVWSVIAIIDNLFIKGNKNL